MTKEESLYQVKLILECLEFDDYRKISDETWNYIEENMEYNENITIDPNRPLEEQNIDEKSMDFLEKVIKEIENYKDEPIYEDEGSEKADNLSDYSKEELIELVERYKKQSDKVSKAKGLVLDYDAVLKKNAEEIDSLKKTNADLYKKIKKCPKLVRKLFFKELEDKLLN